MSTLERRPPTHDDAASERERALIPERSERRLEWRSVHSVWQRNRDVFIRLWHWMLVPHIAEHSMTMVALGFGVGSFITGIGGDGYPVFLAPGLVCAAAMWSAGFECSYGTFFRMEKQRTFDAMIATPVSLDDVVTGELLYGAFRSVASGGLVALVFALMGLLPTLWAVLLLPLTFVIGWMIAGMAITAASRAPSIETLSFFISFALMPMFWLSGVFYDPSAFGDTLRTAQWFSPLYHGVVVARDVTAGSFHTGLLLHVAIMLAVAVVFSWLAIRLMYRRLVR